MYCLCKALVQMRWAPPGKSRDGARARVLAEGGGEEPWPGLPSPAAGERPHGAGPLGEQKGADGACWARSRTQQATRQNGRGGGRLRDVWGVAPAAAAARRTPATWLRSGEDGGTIFLKIYMLDSKASWRIRPQHCSPKLKPPSVFNNAVSGLEIHVTSAASVPLQGKASRTKPRR